MPLILAGLPMFFRVIHVKFARRALLLACRPIVVLFVAMPITVVAASSLLAILMRIRALKDIASPVCAVIRRILWVNSGLAIRPARSPMLILLIAFAVWVLATLRVPAKLVVTVASGAKIPEPVPVQVQRPLWPLVRQDCVQPNCQTR